MARRKDGHLLYLVASAPWPVGFVLGLAAFLGARFGAGWLLANSTNPIFAAFGKALAGGSLNWVAWALLILFWLASLVSWLKSRQRRRLLETQTGIDSLRSIGWSDFEKLVGEVFRHQGFSVTENGLGGADGGIDLVLRRSGETVLVQCKQWRVRKVDVRIVREMYGLLLHHAAQRVVIVSVGDYTTEARRFAEGKPIELIHGESLLTLVSDAQQRMGKDHHSDGLQEHTSIVPEPAPKAPAYDAPACPKCGNTMVLRSNRRTGMSFWGCANFPACRGTQPVSA